MTVDPLPPTSVTLLKHIAFPYDCDDLNTVLEEMKKASIFWNKAYTSWVVGAELLCKPIWPLRS